MKVAVLLSGGVDSSVALWRMKQAGYTSITAFYLKIWLEDELSYLGDCPWEEDLSFATKVCEQASVPLEVINLQLEYFDRVVEYVIAELKEGRTPSPDIFCNQRVKFGAFLDRVGSNFDIIVSGHYAIATNQNTHPWTTPISSPVIDPWEDLPGEVVSKPITRLYRAPDPIKDQTYFLSHLFQDQIAKLQFPVGNLLKNSVRDLAMELNLPNKDRKDSQGICFLGKIPYKDFVRHYLGTRPGAFVNAQTGEELGNHDGFWFYTIGQRSGLGLPGGPWYVYAKDIPQNIIYLNHGTNPPERDNTRLVLEELHWIGGLIPSQNRLKRWNECNSIVIKLRHGPSLVPATLNWIDTNLGQRLLVTMEKPDLGIAAGQFGVIYHGEECLGSGRITDTSNQELSLCWSRYQAWKEIQLQAQANKKQKRIKKP